jgi:hypothetical protein
VPCGVCEEDQQNVSLDFLQFQDALAAELAMAWVSQKGIE